MEFPTGTRIRVIRSDFPHLLGEIGTVLAERFTHLPNTTPITLDNYPIPDHPKTHWLAPYGSIVPLDDPDDWSGYQANTLVEWADCHWQPTKEKIS